MPSPELRGRHADIKHTAHYSELKRKTIQRLLEMKGATMENAATVQVLTARQLEQIPVEFIHNPRA